MVMQSVKWINGDADLMSRVSTSWLNTASVYGSLDTDLRAKMKNLSGSNTEELPDIEEVHGAILDGIETLSDAMRNLAGAVDGYAQVLKAAQENAEWQLTLAQVVSAINAIDAATAGRPIARAILEAHELELEQCRRKIQEGLDGLIAAEQTTSGAFTAASNTVRYVMTAKFQPVLDKQLKHPPTPTRAEPSRAEPRQRDAINSKVPRRKPAQGSTRCGPRSPSSATPENAASPMISTTVRAA